MKRTARKLMSLFMALVMVCSLIPAAMAAEPGGDTTGADTDITWGSWSAAAEGKTLCENDGHSGTINRVEATCTAAGSASQTCTTCGATRTGTIAQKEHTPVSNPTKTDYVSDENGHQVKCSVCGAATGTSSSHSFEDSSYGKDSTNHWHECSVCGYKKDVAPHTPGENATYTWAESGHKYNCSQCQQEVTVAHTWSTAVPVYPTAGSTASTQHTKYCTVCDSSKQHSVSENHTYDTTGKCTVCGYQNSNPAAGVRVSSSTLQIGVGQSQAISYYFVDANGVPTSATATVTISSSNNAIAYVNPNYSNAVTGYGVGTATISLYINGNTTAAATVTVTVKNTANVSVTVSQNQGNFYFTDNTTQEGTSIYDQIVTALGYNYNSSYYNNYYVTVSGSNSTVGTLYGTSYTRIPLSSLGSVYLYVNNTTGTWTGSYKVEALTGTNTYTEVLSGSITINVQPYTGTGIIYSATLGEEVALRVSDFENFWSEFTSGRGTLTSVTINSVSTGTVGGTLCYHTAGERNHSSAANQTFYVSPRTSTQRDLSNLTFFPGSTSNRYRTGTVTISFTATGTNYSTTSYNSSYNTSASGTITILYTNGAVEAINYAATSSYTVLDADDFNAVYRQATATTTTSPTYTVRFLDVPTYGTLYANYSVNSRTGAITGTEITSRNVNTLSFSNRTTGTNSLEKVAYVPGYRGVGDSVRYAVYSGNTLVYVGTVNFGVGTLSVTYACGAAGVTFKATDFFSTSSSLLTSQYITFGTPSSGTLYKSGSVRVTTSDRFGYTASAAAGVQSISTVTYVPVSGYNGVVEIPFTSVSYTGGTISGTVKITVTTKTFTDVPATHWAYSYINRLVGEGVVDGVTPTTYAPSSNVKYGEALKMILIAAGYPAQTEGTGANWASNYLALAYRNGIVSSTSGDLNAAVDRNTIASITAKALKISQASSINRGIIGPTDSRDGYVYALYNVGILNGTTTNGVNRFNGSSSLTRAELAAIVCRVSDYYSANNK